MVNSGRLSPEDAVFVNLPPTAWICECQKGGGGALETPSWDFLTIGGEGVHS